MNKKSTILKSTFLVLSLFLFVSCETRDPETEYETLYSEVFVTPEEGINAAKDYLDYFQDNERAHNVEVKEILGQYKKMDYIYSTVFAQDSIREYTDEECRIMRELASSKYEGVLETWNILYEEDWNRRYKILMDGITEGKFDSYFREEIKGLCAKYYDKFEIQSIQKDSLGPIKNFWSSNRTGKYCDGFYRVHMYRKIIPDFFRDRNMKMINVKISGDIIVDTNDGKYKCLLTHFISPDYNWLDTTLRTRFISYEK